MLDGAGWKIGSDGIRQKNGVKLKFTMSTTAGAKAREQAEAMIQADLPTFEFFLFFGGFLFLSYIGAIFCRLRSIIRNSLFNEMERRLVSYVFAPWFLYLLISNLYGDYFRDTSFSLFSGIAVAIIAGFQKKESMRG